MLKRTQVVSAIIDPASKATVFIQSTLWQIWPWTLDSQALGPNCHSFSSSSKQPGSPVPGLQGPSVQSFKAYFMRLYFNPLAFAKLMTTFEAAFMTLAVIKGDQKLWIWTT